MSAPTVSTSVPVAGEAPPAASPFNPANASGYRAWRERKLAGYPRDPEALVVPVADPAALREDELAALQDRCRRANTAFYTWSSGDPADKALLRRFGRQLGLHRLDGNLCADDDDITSLQVRDEGSRHGAYIPYSNRPLNWHTDGYYNTAEERIRAMVLHCVSDSAEGGANALLDHEIAYLKLRDENPAFISALMHPEAMTIPANEEGGQQIRPEQTGPVFSVDPATGSLHMRYTARKRNIQWREDPLTREAVQFLEALLSSDTPYIFHRRLQPGEGMVSNNALHRRSGFRDDPAGRQRLIYRARYYDRVAGSGLYDCE